jgi:FtsH-binding integral membrane protein
MLISADDGTYIMPKSSKNKAKAKNQLKKKQAVQTETRSGNSSITKKKSYWVMLSVFIVAVFSVAGYILDFVPVNLAVLMIAIVLLISLIGYVSVTPSNLSKSKRGTFLFVGASVIGFSIWAIIMLILTNTGAIETVFDDETAFLIFPSLIICLIIGSFIGELIGKNGRIQKFFFKPKDDL